MTDIGIKKNQYIYLVFAFLAVFVLFYLPMAVAAPIFVVLIGLGMGILLISFLGPAQDRRFLYNLYAAAFLSRVLIAALLYLVTLHWDRHEGFFIDDGWPYHLNGWMIARRILNGTMLPDYVLRRFSASGTLHLYDYINGAVYAFTGKSPLTMLFLNCALGALTLIFVYRLCALFFDKKTCVRATILTAFWPSLFLWSTQNLKEPFIIFIVVVFFWAFLSLLKKFDPAYTIIMILSLFCLMKFSSHIFVFVICGLCLHMLYMVIRLLNKNKQLIVPAAIFLVMFFGLFGERLFQALINFFNTQTSYNLTVESLISEIDYSRSARAYSDLAFMPGYAIKSVKDLIIYLPMGLTAVLLSPFPWQIFSAAQLMGVVEMLVWYFMIAYFIKGICLSFKTRLPYFFTLFFFIASYAGFLALIEGNLGNMFRHRAVIFIFFLIFATVGIGADSGGGINKARSENE
jgi:hypothetical protein